MQIDDVSAQSHKPQQRERTTCATFHQVSHTDDMLDKLALALKRGIMSDVTLVVGTRRYAVHRLILCIASDVFQVMLSSGGFSERCQTEVRLHEACGETEAAFDTLLHYIYTGRVTLTLHACLPLLSLADKYNVKKLSEACLQYMCERVPVAYVEGLLVKWLVYAHTPYHSALIQSCMRFVRWNLDALAVTDQFLEMEARLLEALLQRDDVVVRNEYTLLCHVVRWIEARGDMDTCSVTAAGGGYNFGACAACRLLRHVRFALIPPEQLTHLLGWALAIQHRALFVLRVSAAMHFHAGDWTDKCDEDGDAASLPFTACVHRHRDRHGGISVGWCECTQAEPRLYTDDAWSAGLAIDNYGQLAPFATRSLVFQSAAHCSSCRRPPPPPLEWTVDVWPRGVRFHRAQAIGWLAVCEVPEKQWAGVRVALTPSRPIVVTSAGRSDKRQSVRARVAVLVDGVAFGVRHVAALRTRRWVFSDDEPRLHFDNVVSLTAEDKGGGGSGEVVRSSVSFLLGAGCDLLCVRVVTVPRCAASGPVCSYDRQVQPV